MPAPTPARPDAAPLKYRDQSDETLERDDTGWSCDRSLGVSPEEDRGSDPYNRTGRFERVIR